MLKTIGYLTRIFEPDRFIICWDGAGGSQKRRSVYKEYKEGRKVAKPVRINKNFEFEEEDIQQNKIYQRHRLAEYLRCLPVAQITVRNVEADDVIAQLWKEDRTGEKIIVSSDKDFLQLSDERTTIFQPYKKKALKPDDIAKEYNVYPTNFALVRAMVGDKSDNVKGVRGVGMKNSLKYFPMLSEPEKVTLDDLMDYSTERLAQKDKKYQKFLNNEELIKTNLKIMDLACASSLISMTSIDEIRQDKDKPTGLNSTELRKLLISDGVELGETFFQNVKFLKLRGEGSWKN